MPGTTLPPNQARTLDNGFARTERLERLTHGPGQPDPLIPPLVFSYPGTLADGIESPPWYSSVNVFLLELRLSLLAAATSDHSIDLNIDGTSAGTFTLSTGDLTIATPIGIPVNAGSAVTVITDTVTDANMSVQITVTRR